MTLTLMPLASLSFFALFLQKAFLHFLSFSKVFNPSWVSAGA
jgi:hypothetical protein